MDPLETSFSSFILRGRAKAGWDSARARAARVASEEEGEEAEGEEEVEFELLEQFALKPPASVTCGTNLGPPCLVASASIRLCVRARSGEQAGGTSQKE